MLINFQFFVPIFVSLLFVGHLDPSNCQKYLHWFYFLEWLVKEQIQQLSLVITNISTQETLERWDFKLEYEASSSGTDEVTGNKDIKLIQKEIRDVLRQICSTVSFLPLLDCQCSFDLHIHAKPEAEIPDQWGERGPSYISNSEELQLKSFTTSIHRMNTIVSYKAD